MSTFHEVISSLYARLGTTRKHDLARLRSVLESAGRPDLAFRTIHIAGSVGKGSTAAALDAILRAAGHRVGLFTSPHLHRLNERIRVDGRMIGDGAFDRLYREARDRFGDDRDPATFFELVTLIAALAFRETGIDVAVVETGLGGRLDATNALRTEVSVVTEISLEHTRILGGTLREIAAEKGAIARAGVPFVSGISDPAVSDHILAVAAGLGASPRIDAARHLAIDGLRIRRTRNHFTARSSVFGEVRIDTPLVGEHQARNVRTAIVALEAARARGIAVTREAIEAGLRTTHWPGRFEPVPGQPRLFLDGAHNPGGAEALAATLRSLFPERRLAILFGVLADKDHDTMIRALVPFARRDGTFIACEPESPRALPVRALVEAFAKVGIAARSAASVPEGVARLRELTGEDGIGVVAGSLFLVGPARRILFRRGRARRGAARPQNS